MFDSIKRIIEENNIAIVLLDIDGTIKDLALEHKVALNAALNKTCANKRRRIKVCKIISEFGLYFMKTGILPTNEKMQDNLIRIFSILVNTDYVKLREAYFELYPKEAIMFESIKDVMEELSRKCKVVFVTTNCQTIDMKANGYKIECVSSPKKKLYSKTIQEYGFESSNALIVGDNFWDDYLPAVKLGTKVWIVNRYHSKFKSLLMRLLLKKQ